MLKKKTFFSIPHSTKSKYNEHTEALQSKKTYPTTFFTTANIVICVVLTHQATALRSQFQPFRISIGSSNSSYHRGKKEKASGGRPKAGWEEDLLRGGEKKSDIFKFEQMIYVLKYVFCSWNHFLK